MKNQGLSRISAVFLSGIILAPGTLYADLPKLGDDPPPTISIDDVKRVVPSRDAPTHDDLLQKARTSSQDAFISQFKPSDDQQSDSSKAQVSRDIVRESDILCYRGVATLVPKHALVHVPDALRDRTKLAPGAKVVTWLEFFQANRGWITSFEVKFSEASGEKPFSDDQQKWLDESAKIIVATLRGGPVSVLSPDRGDETQDASATETTQR